MALISSKSESSSPKEPKNKGAGRSPTPPKPSAANLGSSLLDPHKSAGDREPSPETPSATKKSADEQIRPQTLATYIGQRELKEVLAIAIQAAQAREESLDHLLLYGPPGLGKTTMALILAAEMGTTCKITMAPALERPRDIAGLLVNL
ncbi:MAG: AAA family ATPase, partial [Cyanobacteria bacterium P01_F01_bin.153]